MRMRRAWLAFTAAALVVAVAAVLIVNRDGIPRYQRPIPVERSDTALAPWIPRKSRPPASSDYLRPFVTDLAPNGRYFIDQYGAPLLIRGDSPWAMLFDLSPDQVDRYLVARAKLGVNAVLVSLIGARANGGPSDSGTTFDGLRPFVGGDVNRLSAPYWTRVHDYLAKAATLGITVFLYGIDSWSLDEHSLHAIWSSALLSAHLCTPSCQICLMSFGSLAGIMTPAAIATGSDPDRCINQMMRGLRQAGDHQAFLDTTQRRTFNVCRLLERQG